MKRFQISPQALEDLRAHALQLYPEECCGGLLANAESVVVACPLANAAVDRRRGFFISARDYLGVEAKAAAAGLTLVGFYHSHPDGPAIPSLADCQAAWPQWWTVIVSVTAGNVGAPAAFNGAGLCAKSLGCAPAAYGV